MNKVIKLILISFFMLGSVCIAQPVPNLAKPVNIQNFGEPNLSHLKKKIANVERKVASPDSVLRIMQLGDSHTAADIFTGELRQKFQSRFGGAGIGWISPINIYGQRNTQVYYTATDWSLSSSRVTPLNDYPLGGFIATPTAPNAQLVINYNIDEPPSLWNATFLVKPLKKGKKLTVVDGMNYQLTLDPNKGMGWQYVHAFVMLPLTITADSADSVKLGGVWLEKNGQPGAVLSSVGLNGAKLSIWQNWRSQWMNDLAKSKNDLIIIAYGTNESLESSFNADRYKQQLVNDIKQIRKQSPKSVILIVSPPDAMLRSKINRGRSCQAMQPVNLAIIRKKQQEVARQMHTLYWDWSRVMGGDCGMRNWVAKDLGNKDYIHLTAGGYNQSADMLYKALLKILNLS